MTLDPMNQEKVLIVEDEDNERTGLAELISAWGYRTETARDGLEALDKIAIWSPNIVVTDLKMPRMGGMELIEKLDSQPQSMAVVVVTAQGTIDSAVEAMKKGAERSTPMRAIPEMRSPGSSSASHSITA